MKLIKGYTKIVGKHRLHSNSSSNSGFTMIELLVVVAMVGILGAIAAPSWQGFLTKQRLNSARSDLMAVLKDAQDEAQARQQSREVSFLPVTASTPLSVMVRDASSSSQGKITLLGNGEVGNKFSLVASTPIIFDHDGRVDVNTPYKIKIVDSTVSGSSPPQSCVIVTTILGGLKPANDDLCDSF